MKLFIFGGLIIGIITIIGAIAIFIAVFTNLEIVIETAPDMHSKVEILIDDIRTGNTVLTKDQQADKMVSILKLDKESIAFAAGQIKVLYIVTGLLLLMGLIIVFQSLYFNAALKKYEGKAK